MDGTDPGDFCACPLANSVQGVKYRFVSGETGAGDKVPVFIIEFRLGSQAVEGRQAEG